MLRERKGEAKGERNTDRLPSVRTPPGTEPDTQACALMGIGPAAFWCTGRSTNRATQARLTAGFYSNHERPFPAYGVGLWSHNSAWGKETQKAARLSVPPVVCWFYCAALNSPLFPPDHT